MNRNSALLWFPKIEVAGLPVPRTVFVSYDHDKAVAAFDGDYAEMDRLQQQVLRAGEGAFGYPWFVRTDLSSAKHGGERCYRINGVSDLPRAIRSTVEDNEMKFWLERHGPTAFMVREFLDLDAGFSAFGGLPIAREWRFFVRKLKTGAWACACLHPYWPPGSIEFYAKGDEPAGWREILADHHELDFTVMMELSDLALKAGEACGGNYWSVDFARDRSGAWWLIDMAHGDDSFHWPECANAPKEPE